MRRLATSRDPACPLLAASAPVAASADPLDAELQERARGAGDCAEAKPRGSSSAAGEARDEAEPASRATRGRALRRSTRPKRGSRPPNAQLRLASAYVAAHREQLWPSSNAGGVAAWPGLRVMAQRPPLLALADRGGTDELVKVRVLLDSTCRSSAARTSGLSAQLAEGRRLEQSAVAARAELVREPRSSLSAKRRSGSPRSSNRPSRSALAAGGQALGAGDVALAAGERRRAAARGRGGQPRAARGSPPNLPAPIRRRRARSLPRARQRSSPSPISCRPRPPVTEGLGSVNASGVQSRGLTLATPRGAPVVAPAAGIVRFAGPFRDYDGIVIIDHGGGWMTPDRQRRLAARGRRPGPRSATRSAGRSARSRSNCPKMGGESRPLSSQVHLQTLSKAGKGG